MRSHTEILRAHDLLVGIILDENLRRELFGNDRLAFECMKANADVLCWLLGHAHNQTFAKNLRGVEERLAMYGVAIKDLGRLQ